MTTTPSRKRAPGPRGLPLVGNLIPFRRDALRLLLDSRRTFGDVVRFTLGPMVIHLLAHPEHVRQVLVTRQHNYDKDTRSSSVLRGMVGEGLLTASGDFWLRQRRLMQPVFQHQRLAGLVPVLSEATGAMLKRWQAHAGTGLPLDIASEMMRLTCTVVARALFGADLAGDLAEVERAATVALAHTYRRLEHILVPPLWLPTPGNLRFRRAMKALDAVVWRILAGRRGKAEGDDLLSLLLRQRDEETGRGMGEEQVRNETITLLLAGHETTANALTWTWFLLSKYPAAARRLREEVRAVLGERDPAFDDLPRLRYTTAVIHEAMRLFPPIWVMERHVRADDEVAGYHLPAGSTVALSPYVTHRHPDFWPDPEGFDPERFLPEQSARRVPYSYIPFGGGQRLCIGNHLALLEAQVIVALTARAYRLDLVPGFRVEPQPGITLRSRHGMLMTVHAS